MSFTKKRELISTVLIEILTKFPLYGFEFLLASWLSIDQYAEWVSLGIVYRLAPYLHLGALSYFNKRYPSLLGAGFKSAAKQTQKQANSVINYIIILLLLLTLFIYFANLIKTTLFWVICGVLIIQVFSFCQAKVRNEGFFLAYAIGLIIFSVSQLIMAYFTVQHYGVLAGVLSVFGAYLLAIIYYLGFFEIDYKYIIAKRRNIKRVLKLGWPPFLLTISAFLIQISDRVALALLDDDYKLAVYGFFAIFYQIGIIAINSLGKVLSPYIFYLSGQYKNLVNSTNENNSKLTLNHNRSLVVSINTCYLILALYLCIILFLSIWGNELIYRYFPKFAGSLLGVYNYSATGILIALTMAFYPQFMVAGKEFIIVIINFLFCSLGFIIIYLLAAYFKGFFAYSFGSFILNEIYAVIILIFTEKIVAKKLHLVRLTLIFVGIVNCMANLFFRLLA